MSGIDFAKDLEENPPQFTDDQVKMIANLAERQVTIEAYMAKCEANLEAAKANWRKIAEVDLPNAMAEVGMSQFKLTNGTIVKIGQEVYASIPKDNTGPAFAWLREHNLDGVIKNVVSVQFAKGEDAKALELAHNIADQGLLPEQTQTVHPMTLKALLKEQLEKGVDVPMKEFGAYSVNRAKVVLDK